MTAEALPASPENLALDHANQIFAWLQQPANGSDSVLASTVCQDRIGRIWGVGTTLDQVRDQLDDLDGDERTAMQLLVAGFDDDIIEQLFDHTVMLAGLDKVGRQPADQQTVKTRFKPGPAQTEEHIPLGKRLNSQPYTEAAAQQLMGELKLLDEDEADWQTRALCAQTDPEAFFPEKGGSTRDAKRICLGCEVRDACLKFALAHDERFGIWGGLSERERRKLKKRRV